jgi:NAD(P)-dependent dehydrogenase (short-subunit alcohol dehydrogenase family)
MHERLRGQHALITGSARGIGRAIASRFVSEGAAVLALDLDRDAGAVTAAALGCRFRALDVRSEADWAALEDEPVDILVNNAGGLLTPALVHEHDVDTWRATLELNLTSVFLGMRWAIRQMLARKTGVIINMCSVSGIVGQPDAPAYQAAKAGVALLTRNTALAYASRGIRVNAVSPSVVATPALDDEPPERVASFLAHVPLGRPAEPEDIAAAVAYLASDDARYVTGTNLTVDGGYSA